MNARARGSERAIQQEVGVLVLVMVGSLVLARDRRIARDVEIDRSIDRRRRASNESSSNNTRLDFAIGRIFVVASSLLLLLRSLASFDRSRSTARFG